MTTEKSGLGVDQERSTARTEAPASVPLTPDELIAIERRAEAAHPGPWKVVGADNWRLEGFPQVEMNTPEGDYFPATNDADAQFIANARTDVPRLIAEVRRLLK